jgi:hypothetical protein
MPNFWKETRVSLALGVDLQCSIDQKKIGAGKAAHYLSAIAFPLETQHKSTWTQQIL